MSLVQYPRRYLDATRNSPLASRQLEMVMLLSSPFDSLIKRSKRLEYILTLAGSAEADEKNDKEDTA